mgnify:FL=1
MLNLDQSSFNLLKPSNKQKRNLNPAEISTEILAYIQVYKEIFWNPFWNNPYPKDQKIVIRVDKNPDSQKILNHLANDYFPNDVL